MVEGSHFVCSKRGELCSLYHSIEERDIANKVIRKQCKDVNYNESMQQYIKVLDDNVNDSCVYENRPIIMNNDNYNKKEETKQL